MKSFFRKLGWLRRRGAKEDELRAELEFHLSEEADERQAQGLSQAEAQRAARRDLGNLTQVQESTRAAWGWILIEQFFQDLRYAFRTMAANPLFTVLAAASLALGIGANTAIYSFMDAILLRSLPVADPQSLVVFNWHARPLGRDFVMHGMSGTTYNDPDSGTTATIFPYPAFELFRKNDAIFSSVFAHCQGWQVRKLNVSVRGQADVGSGWNVSGDFFGGLGVPAVAGRMILPDDDRPGVPAVAVVSYAFSQRRFGGAAEAVGQPIQIDNLPFTVVGVAPPAFFGVDSAFAPDLYVPMHTNELLGANRQFGFQPSSYLEKNEYWVNVMGRLRPGVSLTQAQAALASQFHQWVASTAANDKERASLPELVLKPGASGWDTVRRVYSKPLYVLLILVALILMLACANVANLLLARASARQREIALRMSVGAGRFRIVRQLLTESVLLASLGGVLGVMFAFWGIRFLTLLLANGQENFTLRAELNWHVLGVAIALSLMTGVLFGLAPALAATRVDAMPALKESRSGQPISRHFFRRLSLSRILVVGQIAISLLLLVAAGLFVRTLAKLESIELGFNSRNLLLFEIDARKAGHKDPEIEAFYAELRRRVAAIPGVRSATLAEGSLIGGESGLPISVAGAPPNDANRIFTVGPSFFTTMQIPILSGRDFEERDRPGSQAVAVVNQVFAQANFPKGNPLVQHLILRVAGEGDRVGRDMEIVGVANNARYGGLTRNIPPVVYLPYDQGYPKPNQMTYELRTTGDPMRYVSAVRETVHQLDARVPISDVRSQTGDIDNTIGQEITFAELCSAFAALALLIACVGLYGTVSYNVARRTSEIGIRMALGAQSNRVVWLVLREVCAMSALGLAIGLPAALASSRLVQSFLFETKPNDPRALAAAVTILLSAALLAGFIPARRASRIDPLTALRHE
ncbi:MAG TPA: ABC transporter permease [Bryobacteraceae bacterium]|nr:ABC transporter permease [Bryobacteraceae bacterium]